MTFDELRNLDIYNVGSWPAPVKALALVVLVGVVVFLGWYFIWSDRMEQLEEVTQKEQELRDEFKSKQQRAANLEDYKEQLEKMRDLFRDLLDQLPARERVPDLIKDISGKVLESGLAVELFNPQGSRKKDFYAEKPVKIRVTGTYDEMGRFVSGVANMPRIVTLGGIQISRNDGGNAAQGQPANLTMDVTAKTYWYLQDGSGR